jgi:hypothetical protein
MGVSITLGVYTKSYGMEFLLKAGAESSKWNKYGEIPMAYSAIENNKEGALILLQYGADIDATDDRRYMGHGAFRCHLGKRSRGCRIPT